MWRTFVTTSTLLFLLLIGLGEVHAKSTPATIDSLGAIPVQHDGRVKPFASFAREAVLYITGKTSFQSESPTFLVWKWMATANDWRGVPMIPVKLPELREVFSAHLKKGRIAPVWVIRNSNFLNEIEALQAKQGRQEKLSRTEKKKMDLYGRAVLFEQIVAGRVPGMVPHPNEPHASWFPMEGIGSEEGVQLLSQLYASELLSEVKTTYDYLLSRLGEEDIKLAAVAADFFSQSLRELLASRNLILDSKQIQLEVWYFKIKPFQLAWILYLASVVLMLFSNQKKLMGVITFFAFLIGFGMHTAGFLMRVFISGRAPVTNMYESIVWVSWAVVLFSFVLWGFYRKRLLLAGGSLCCITDLNLG